MANNDKIADALGPFGMVRMSEGEEINPLTRAPATAGNVEALFKTAGPKRMPEVLASLPREEARAVAGSIIPKAFEAVPQAERAELAAEFDKVINGVSLPSPQVYQLMEANVKEESRAQGYRMKYLATFTPDQFQGAAPKGAAEMAKSAIISALKLGTWEFDELLGLAAVQYLKTSKDAGQKDVFGLLEDIINGNVGALGKMAGVAKANGLDLEDVTQQTRHLALCRMANTSKQGGSSDFTFAEISEELKIPEEEVEALVAHCIGKGLLTAKISLTQRTVSIAQAHFAVFGADQWETMAATLEKWEAATVEIMNKMDAVM